jgi:hypothetical protein
MQFDAVRDAVEARLGATGKVVARIAHTAAEAMAERRARIAGRVADLLVLHQVDLARKAPG